ncbi:MAG: hypothetical protein E7Z93_03325 [Cyanobacteria bacterium SIG32]|nr:hypothetical protein [Cyanobacteria bacterium SIG32]
MPVQNNISFGSQLKPTRTLKQGFNLLRNNQYHHPYDYHNFANSVEAILNDGSDDVIEITKNNTKGILMAKVNGKIILTERDYADNAYGKGKIFIGFLTSLANQRNPKVDILELSDYEREEVIKPIVRDLVNLTFNKQNNNSNSLLYEYLDVAENIKNKICEANFKKIFETLEPKIFNDNI